MKVVITGGAGYIGSHVCLAVHRSGHTPVIIDNFSNSSPACVRRLGELIDDVVECHNVDVCDAGMLNDVFAAVLPGAVIHCAGLKAVGESFADPLHYYEKNILGAVNVLRAMDVVGTSRVIFSSSATVYGDPEYLPYDEQHRLAPENPYGRTKLFIEHLIHDWDKAGKNRSAVLLRYFNPIGAHPSGLIGEDPNDIPNNLMPYILDVAAGKRPDLKVFGDDYQTPDGTGVRDYIHVEDLADGHVAALGYAAHHTGVDTFNLGTGRGYSVLEVIAAFERASNRQIPYEVVARRAGDIAEFFADASKASETFGWSPNRDLDRMCADAWNWRVKNPNGYSE